MRDVVILFVHLIVTVVRLARPGGLRSFVAESVLVKVNYRTLIAKLEQIRNKPQKNKREIGRSTRT